MIEVKRVEIRDAATFVPALALKLTAGAVDVEPLLSRAGFKGEFVLLVCLESMRVQYDPFSWGGRTLPVAHRWVRDNWDRHPDGGVVDVQFILGETRAPKESEVGP